MLHFHKKDGNPFEIEEAENLRLDSYSRTAQSREHASKMVGFKEQERGGGDACEDAHTHVVSVSETKGESRQSFPTNRQKS